MYVEQKKTTPVIPIEKKNEIETKADNKPEIDDYKNPEIEKLHSTKNLLTK